MFDLAPAFLADRKFIVKKNINFYFWKKTADHADLSRFWEAHAPGRALLIRMPAITNFSQLGKFAARAPQISARGGCAHQPRNKR
jgi:hypothetical protein